MAKNTYNAIGLPWASGMGTPVDTCKTSREVMKKAGLDYPVDTVTAFAEVPFRINSKNTINEAVGEHVYNGKKYIQSPKGRIILRTDKNIPFGIVDESYKVVQNIDVFNFFDDAIGEGKAQWQHAGKFGYGERIFVSAKLPKDIKVGDDIINNYLVFSNSHDGSSAVQILFTPIRVFCMNCLNSAFKKADAYIKFKHTKNVKNKLTAGAEILKNSLAHCNTLEHLYNSMFNFKMSDVDVMQYICEIMLTDEELEGLRTFKLNTKHERLFDRDEYVRSKVGVSQKKLTIITDMYDYYKNGVAQEPINGTSWGAYNAITGYFSNYNTVDDSAQDRCKTLLYGGAVDITTKAFTIAYKKVA